MIWYNIQKLEIFQWIITIEIDSGGSDNDDDESDHDDDDKEEEELKSAA